MCILDPGSVCWVFHRQVAIRPARATGVQSLGTLFKKISPTRYTQAVAADPKILLAYVQRKRGVACSQYRDADRGDSPWFKNRGSGAVGDFDGASGYSSWRDWDCKELELVRVKAYEPRYPSEPTKGTMQIAKFLPYVRYSL